MKSLFFIPLCVILFLHVAAQEPLVNTKMSYNQIDSLFNIPFSQGNFKAALSIAEVMVEKSKTEGDTSINYINSINKLAATYLYLNENEKAEALFLEALNIIKMQLGNLDPKYANTLSNLAAIYWRTGQLDKAEAFLKESLEIEKIQSGENSTDYATDLNNLAAINYNMGNFPEAEKLYTQALEILKKLLPPYDPHLSMSYNNLANLYEKMGQFDKSEALYLKTMAIQQKNIGNKHPDFAQSNYNIGVLYRFMGKYEQAFARMNSAIEIWQEVFGTQHPDVCRGYYELAKLCRGQQQYELARKYYFKAIEANLRQKDSNETIVLDKLSQKEFLSDELILVSLESYALFQQLVYDATKDISRLDTAFLSLKAAIEINDGIRNRFSLDSDKFRTLANMSNLVGKAIEVTWENKKEMDYATLFSFSELNKSVLLADATKTQKARVLGDLPDSLVQQELQLQQKSDEMKRQAIFANSPERKAALVQATNSLQVNIDAFKKRLESEFPGYFKLKYASITATVPDVQKLLDAKSALLEYFVTDSTVYLFVVTASNLYLKEIHLPGGLLKEQSGQLRQALSDYEFIKKEPEEAFQLYTKTAYWFYQKILAPGLIDLKGINQLILVTDGVLGHLPFEAFLTAETKAEQSYADLPYLLNDYKVSYNYAATLWKENMEGLSKTKTRNGRMLALAASYRVKEDSTSIRANRSENLRNLRDALQDLPAAKEEVEALSKRFQGMFLYAKDANERDFKKNASDFGVIHLAMHGLLNKRAPILSSLAFTEDGDSLEDNFLEAWEISQLRLNAQLVVLSACETGYGKFQQGEGVMSLARSFMYAGVPSLVVSMWQVNDASTSAIMQSFYKNLAKGMDKAEALQQAKLTYIQSVDGIAAHPAFWAPFVQLGDSRAIAVEVRGGGWLMWWIGGGLLAIAAICAVLWACRKRKAL